MNNFILITLVVSPPILWFILFLYISDNQPDGSNKREAQANVFKETLKHPIFWAWVCYVIFVVKLAF